MLNRSPERHIRCDPILAQFIRGRVIRPVEVEGVFSKAELDPEFVQAEEARVTSGYLRLAGVDGGRPSDRGVSTSPMSLARRDDEPAGREA